MQTLPKRDEFIAAVAEFLHSQILNEGVRVETDTALLELGLDSAALIEIVLFVERRFGIAIPDEAMTRDNFRSLEALAHCVGVGADTAASPGD